MKNDKIFKDLLENFKEATYGPQLTSKIKLNLLQKFRMHKEAFTIGNEPLGNFKVHERELFLDIEIPYTPMLRRPPYRDSLETRKQVENHINEILEMEIIRKIGHNEIVEVPTTVLITWNDGKSRFCGDFRALNNYT
ncbi:hypothetical protein O181_014785 [Austropuccinia psidii MF-1]|uniref:Uncharacterized protein n=1 Tax=Austropuccinia psidii MF-1 TaxID=1389203 RepID=A0A9Q3C1M0_9BASI|nr:hypothetical protein [Austropuccinia psidii MF-1]